MTNSRCAVVLVALLAGAGVVGCSGGGNQAGSGGAPGSGGGGTGSGSTSSATSGSSSSNSSVSGSGTATTASSSGAGTGGGGTGGGGTSTGGQCPANAIFCADFESGTIPAAAVYYPAYQQSSVATYMTVDATMGNHGSAHSLKVTPGTNFSQMLGVKTGQPTFWTRVYLQTSMVNTSAVTGHDTFVAGIDSAAGGTLAMAGDPNNGEAVRVGEHECQLELNRKSDDKEILSDAVGGVSNYTCAGGITFSPGTWYCVEAFYDGPNSSVRVFVDGAEVTALHVTDWGPHAYDMFKFGFENYSGTARTLWYDDVAIAPQQIGCFP